MKILKETEKRGKDEEFTEAKYSFYFSVLNHDALIVGTQLYLAL